MKIKLRAIDVTNVYFEEHHKFEFRFSNSQIKPSNNLSYLLQYNKLSYNTQLEKKNAE